MLPNATLCLGSRHLSPVVSKLTRGVYTSVERRAADLELGAQVGDMGVAVGHGRLSEADLVLGQLERAPAPTTAGPGGGEARQGAFADEITLRLSEGGEYPEDELPT
jgi:hypothetical protein